jgi:hypothetical protein
MLTVEVKLNGRLVGYAKLVNQSNLADVSDYSLLWTETGDASLGIATEEGRLRIERHNRRQTVWALVAKAAAAILGQKVKRMEGKR